MAAAKIKPHAHACCNESCRTRYEDSCTSDKVNEQCRLCRLGVEWVLLVTNRAPKDCCMMHSRLARKEEITIFRLAGDTAWWICPKCARTQGYDPTKRNLFETRRTPQKEMAHG